MMISVDQAINIIKEAVRPLPSENLTLENALGRVLDECILADRDFPPYDRAAMDGIAIAHKGILQTSYKILGEQVAGAPQKTLTDVAGCFEIMTGASLPKGADTVIRYEDVEIENEVATLLIQKADTGQHIHSRAKDAKEGDVLIETGKMINTGDIGILASVGKTMIRVKKLPRVALVSTGDELVEPDKKPLDHQIRKSNIYTLQALLEREGMKVDKFHFNDVYDELKIGLTEISNSFDVLLLSGGVSKGKRDYIPEVLEEIGIKKHFHRIGQRPGKPMWFGQNEKITVFGFPGNPVSTLVCYTLYFKKWLNNSLGIQPFEMMAELTEDIHFKPDLIYHVPVSISYDENRILATPFLGHGSGDLVNLSKADGFLTLPDGKDLFQKGEAYAISPFSGEIS